MTIRVLIVDDQILIRQALKSLLAEADDLEVVGEAKDGSEAIGQVERLHPDVVLMDVVMPVMDGVAATEAICRQFENVKVLVLSIDDDEASAIAALRHGAAGYLFKNIPPEELSLAIRAVQKGYTYLSPGLGRKIISQLPDPHQKCPDAWQELTARERQIAEQIVRGANNREIARTLSLSEKTVKNHITRILHRLDLRNRTQIVALFAQTYQP